MISHFVKLVYFGGIIDQAATLNPALAGVAIAASMPATTLSRRILEARTDLQFRCLGAALDHDGGELLYPLRKLVAGRAQQCAGQLMEREARWPTSDPLVLDLIEWIEAEPRLYAEVIETWRTSCPRLIWEGGRSRLCRTRGGGRSRRAVAITESGKEFLRAHGWPN